MSRHLEGTIACISLTWFVYDRQSLNREYQLEVMKGHVKGSGESVQNDEKINKFTKGISVEDDPISIQRREKVKDAKLHAWTSYEKYAWGKDELKPQSMDDVDSFGGLGATLVDSLDTLYIMGLDAQFKRAREVLGGLLSAYDLSGDCSDSETKCCKCQLRA